MLKGVAELANGYWFNQESNDKRLLRLLTEMVQKLGRLPTSDEVNRNEEMPNANEYAFCFGSFERALARVARALRMEYDLDRLRPPTPRHIELGRTPTARQGTGQTVHSTQKQAQTQVVRRVASGSKSAYGWQRADDAKKAHAKEDVDMGDMEKKLAGITQSVERLEACEDSGNIGADASHENVEGLGSEETSATPADIPVVAAENPVTLADVSASEEVATETVDAPAEVMDAPTKRGKRYGRDDIVALLRRARDENGGKIPSQAQARRINYLPAWGTMTRKLGSPATWGAILDEGEKLDENKAPVDGVTTVVKRDPNEVLAMLARGAASGGATMAQEVSLDEAITLPDGRDDAGGSDDQTSSGDRKSEILEQQVDQKDEVLEGSDGDMATTPKSMQVVLRFLDGKISIEATRNVEIKLATTDGQHFAAELYW